MNYPQYSIVIPAYNEAARITNALESVVGCIRSHGWNAEVVVVDGGSRDETAPIVRQFAAREPRIRLLQNPGNRGKGYSVRNGMLQSLGEIVMFTDADLSAPIEEAEGLFSALAAGADIAIGSRWLERTRQTIRQPLYRQFFGRCFNAVTRMIMGLPFADTQCGFKMFTHAAAQAIFGRLRRYGPDAPLVVGPMVTAFDVEVLFMARKLGYRISEVPVLWEHGSGSKVRPFVDTVRMVRDVLLVRWNDLQGRYRG